MALASLYPWARRLPAVTAADALIAVSLGAGDAPTLEAAIATLGRVLRQHPLPLLGELPPADAAWSAPLAPPDLAEAFQEAHHAVVPAGASTLAVPAHAFDTSTPRDWYGSLTAGLRASPRVEQVVLDDPARGSARWSWPLRIGVLTPRAGLGGLQALFDHRWYGLLFELASARTRPHRFDLLLVEGSGPQAMGGLGRSGADGVVVVRLGPTASSQVEVETLRLLAASARAIIAARVERSPGEWKEWLTSVVASLAHGDPLHTALRFAPGDAIVVGDSQQLPHLQLLSTVEASLEQRAQRTSPLRGPPEAQRLPGRLEQLLQIPQATSKQVIDGVRAVGLQSLVYESEDQGATTLGTLQRFLDDNERRDALRAIREHDAGRFLQARLHRSGQAATPPFQPAPHQLDVRIGPTESGWLQGSETMDPPEQAPSDARGWRLRVVMWEPRWMPEPQEQPLWLPDEGPTEVASFTLQPDEAGATEPFAARVVVLHANRVLQTGLLTVDAQGGRFRVDAAPEAQLSRIDSARWFDASIVLNDDRTGRATGTVSNEDQLGVAALPADVFEDFTKRVSKALGEIAKAPDAHADLDSDATLVLLRDLARVGFKLFRSLTRGAGIDADQLRSATHVQIVSTHAHTFFPAEFLYDFPVPSRDATLCGGARHALENDRACEHPHDARVVCPLGFWSLRKLIERHAHRPDNISNAGPYQLFGSEETVGRRIVDPLRDVLFAASHRANGHDKEATAKVVQTARALPAPIDEVSSWPAWNASIAAQPRSLLLILPHFAPGDELEIGTGSLLDLVEEGHVRPTTSEGPGPITVLLGCHTLITRMAYNDFVQEFLWSGSQAVLATYGTILGRHAGPGASHLLSALKEATDAAEPVRLARVLQQVKRQLLLEGSPMILGLTAHGDAALLLHRHPNQD